MNHKNMFFIIIIIIIIIITVYSQIKSEKEIKEVIPF